MSWSELWSAADGGTNIQTYTYAYILIHIWPYVTRLDAVPWDSISHTYIYIYTCSTYICSSNISKYLICRILVYYFLTKLAVYINFPLETGALDARTPALNGHHSVMTGVTHSPILRYESFDSSCRVFPCWKFDMFASSVCCLCGGEIVLGIT